MATVWGPAYPLSTTPPPRCPLHYPQTPAMVMLQLHSQVAALGPLQSPSRASISHLIPPPLHHLPRRPPLHCHPTQLWQSRSFPGWKSVDRPPSRKPVLPATTLAMVCSFTPTVVCLFALVVSTIAAGPSLYLFLPSSLQSVFSGSPPSLVSLFSAAAFSLPSPQPSFYTFLINIHFLHSGLWRISNGSREQFIRKQTGNKEWPH